MQPIGSPRNSLNWPAKVSRPPSPPPRRPRRREEGDDAPRLAAELMEIGGRYATLPDAEVRTAYEVVGYNDLGLLT